MQVLVRTRVRSKKTVMMIFIIIIILTSWKDTYKGLKRRGGMFRENSRIDK